MDAELTGLAWDVGACVPGVSEGVERLVGEFVDLFVPVFLGVRRRLDGTQTTFA